MVWLPLSDVSGYAAGIAFLTGTILVHMQASPTSAGCEEEGLVVCRGGHIGGQPGPHTLQPCSSITWHGSSQYHFTHVLRLVSPGIKLQHSTVMRV